MLKLFIRPHQLTNKQGDNVIIQCNGNRAEYIAGDVSDAWVEVTEDTDGLKELELFFKTDDTTNRISESSASLQIRFVGAAHQLIESHLFATPCNYLNYFDARIEDSTCNVVFREFVLKPDNIEYCEDDGCFFELPLREDDSKANVMKKLSIHDNWQQWFSEDGTKTHPTFQLIRQAPEYSFAGVRAGLIVFVKSIIAVGDLLNSLFDFEKTLKRMLGFGYYCPAPKIYDILKNACDRSGLQMNTPFDETKELHNDCLFIPYGGHFYTNFNEGYQASPSMKHIWMNRYIWQVSEFIDALCELYNLKWDIISNTLVITDFNSIVLSSNFVSEFPEVENVCYEFDLTKKASYGRYQYQPDPQDAASNEIAPFYNDIVDFDGEADNPLLEGEKRKEFNFSPVAFLHDYIGDNYVKEMLNDAKITAYVLTGILAVATAALFAGTITVTAGVALGVLVSAGLLRINTITKDLEGDYGDGSPYRGIIRVQGTGERSIPSIIRYDATTPMNNAKAVAVPVASITTNPNYNPDAIAYKDQNFGIGVYKDLQYAYNYPLYFDAMYDGNLFEKHEATDNPIVVNISNKDVSFEVQLCCDTIISVGVEFGKTNIVGRVIKVRTNMFVLVSEAKINYQSSTISIKGKLLLS